MSFSIDEIKDLMKEFENSSLSDFKYTKWHETLEFSKGGKVQEKSIAISPAALNENANIGIASNDGNTKKLLPDKALDANASTSSVNEAQSDKAAEEKAENPNVVELKSPLAGVFYRSPKPGEKPYVEVGQSVKNGETVGLIEAMKMISEIPSPVDGKIISIELSDGEFSEYDKVLMKIEKTGYGD